MSRVCARRGLPPTLTLQSLIPMVASSFAFFFQPRPAPRGFRPLGSPASSSRSQSAMVTPPHLIPIVPFFSHLAPSKSLSTSSVLALLPAFSHNSTLPRAVLECRRYGLQSRGLLAPPPATSTPLSRSSDMKKASDFCSVEATLVRLFHFSVTERLWHFLANFLCGSLSQVRLGGPVSSPWVDSGIVHGRVLSPLLFNLLIGQSRCHSSFPVSPSLPLTPSVTSTSSVLMTSSL